MREYGDTFLLAPFREFYREVMRLRRMLLSGAWVAPVAGAQPGEAEDLKAQTGTWVYFPDVIPGTEVEEERDVRAAAWVAPPGGAPAPWDVPPPHKANGGNGGNGSKASAPAEAADKLVPSDEIKVGTFVWQRLLSLFERQEAQAWRYGGTYGAEFYKEAQYVMVALADEIFLNTQWEGRRFWVSNLLESKIFRTHVAGELFFQRLDRLLVDRDPVYRDLAAVYLMALSLGFRGKYRGQDDRGQLERYRRQLFHFVFRREPELENETRHVFPEAYYHTLRQETRRRMPNPRAWVILLVAVVLAYVTMTHGIWVKLTGKLFETNEQIERTVGELGGGR